MMMVMEKKKSERKNYVVLCGRYQPPNYRRLPWKEFASRGDLCLCQVDMKHAALDHRGPVCSSRCPTTWQPQRGKGKEGGRVEEAGNQGYHLHSNSHQVLTHLPRPFLLNFLPSFFLSLSPSLPPPNLKRAVFNWQRGKKKQTYAARHSEKREITTETQGLGDVENIRSPPVYLQSWVSEHQKTGKENWSTFLIDIHTHLVLNIFFNSWEVFFCAAFISCGPQQTRWRIIFSVLLVTKFFSL